MERRKFERTEKVGQTKSGSEPRQDWRKKALYNWDRGNQEREVAQIASPPHGPEQAVHQDRNEPHEVAPPAYGLPSYEQAVPEKVNQPHKNVPEAPLTVIFREKPPEIRDLQPNRDNMPQRTKWQKFVNVAKEVILGHGDRPARTEEQLRQANRIRRDIRNNALSPSDTLDLPPEVQLKLAKRVKSLGDTFVEQFGLSIADWGKDSFTDKLTRNLPYRLYRLQTEAGQRAYNRQVARRNASSYLENVCRELGEIRSNCKSVQDLRDIINEAGDLPHDNKQFKAAIDYFDQTLTGSTEKRTQFEKVRAEILERYLPTWMPNPDRRYFKTKEWNDVMTAVHEHPHEAVAADILDKLRIVTNQRELKAAWNRIPEKIREEYDRGNREKFENELRMRTFNAAKAFAAMKNGSFQDRSDKKKYARDLRAFSVISADVPEETLPAYEYEYEDKKAAPSDYYARHLLEEQDVPHTQYGSDEKKDARDLKASSDFSADLPDRPQETYYSTVEEAPPDYEYDDKQAVPHTRDRSDEKKDARDLKASSDFSADLPDRPQETYYPTVEEAPPPDYDDKQAVPHTRDRSDKKKSDAQDKRAAFNREVASMLTHIEGLLKTAQELKESKSNGDKTINDLIQQTNNVRKWAKEKKGGKSSGTAWEDYRKNRRNPDKKVVAAKAYAYLHAALLETRGRFGDAWDLNRRSIRE